MIHTPLRFQNRNLKSLATFHVRFSPHAVYLGGTIDCRITGPRHHSSDLPQGGLEVLCILIFKGDAKYVCKVVKLIKPFEMKKRKYEKEVNGETQPSKRHKDIFRMVLSMWKK